VALLNSQRDGSLVVMVVLVFYSTCEYGLCEEEGVWPARLGEYPLTLPRAHGVPLRVGRAKAPPKDRDTSGFDENDATLSGIPGKMHRPA
jgi:hypothetical protein